VTGPAHSGAAWPLPASRAERLRLATDYPYAAPRWDMLFRDGRVAPLAEAGPRARVRYGDRVPVLAHGSNRAPAQLARKFHDFTGARSAIPVTYVWLHDHDVVYAAHLTRYGAVASTLWPAPGTRVRVAVTWLDEAQLARMHATEGGYGFGRLVGARAAPASEHAASPAAADFGPGPGLYLNDHGALAPRATPWGLAAVPAAGRTVPARTQGQVQEALRRLIAPEAAFEPFVLAAVDDPALRKARGRRLRASGFAHPLPNFHLAGV